MKAAFGRFARKGASAIGFMALLGGLSTAALAHGIWAPEIDPGSVANALLVLSGGLLIVGARRPRKK